MNDEKTNSGVVEPENTAGLPEVVGQSVITLFGIEVRVYVLDDGRRVVHADDTAKLLEQMNERHIEWPKGQGEME